MTDRWGEAARQLAENPSFFERMEAIATALSDAYEAGRHERQEEIAEMTAALDAREIESGLTSNGNLWRFWAAKAKEMVAKNADLMREAGVLTARVAELERACGAAAIASILDLARTGVSLAECQENSATRLVAAASGLRPDATPEEIVAFRNAYMERFAPKGGSA